MHRREVLALSATALASIAGCTDGSNDTGGGTTPGRSDGSETPSTSSADETTPTVERVSVGETVGGSVTVQDVTVRQSVRHLTYPDAMDVYAPPERQFVFANVRVTASDPRPGRDAFGLVVDGETYDPLADIDGYRLYRVRFDGGPYPPPEEEQPAEGFLLFELPRGVSADDAAVTLRPGEAVNGVDRVRWSLSSEARSAVTPPYPDTRLVSLDVPDSVSGESIPLTLTVANEGEADGVFRAAVNHQGPLYGAMSIDVTVPAGEERTVERSIGYDWGDASEIDFTVAWPGGSRGASVQIE